VDRDAVAGKGELAAFYGPVQRDPRHHPRRTLDAGDLDGLRAIAPEGHGPGVVIDRAHAGAEQLHERALQDMDVLNARRSDPLVRSAAQVEHHVLVGCGFEQVERVVGWQDAADAVAPAHLGKCDLAVDDDVRPALDSGDDHVHALRRPVERGAVSQVALDDFGPTHEQRVERGTLAGNVPAADQQADAGVGLVQQVTGDLAAQHAGCTGEENGLGHRRGPFVFASGHLAVPQSRIRPMKLDSAFQAWNNGGRV
jgi:hypothetical protein